MTDGRRAALLSTLRGLDRAELAAFVRDCYRARGWRARIDGIVVIATDGAATRVVLPVPTRRWLGPLAGRVAAGASRPDRPVDVVFAPAATPATRDLAADLGARLVAGEAAFRMVWYAVDAADRAELCRTHLGGPPAALSPPVETRLRRAGRAALEVLFERAPSRSSLRSPGGALLVVVVLAAVPLVAVGLLGGAAGQLGATITATDGSTPSNPTTATPSRAGQSVKFVTPVEGTTPDPGLSDATLHHLRSHVGSSGYLACRADGSCTVVRQQFPKVGALGGNGTAGSN